MPLDAAEVGAAAEAAGRETVRIPSNVMGLLRRSYDTREKMLDWLLAFVVAGVMIYAFRGPLLGFVWATSDPEEGKPDPPVPNSAVGQAFPNTGIPSRIYTYNMPSSRNYRNFPGPSGTRPPENPSCPPDYTKGL